MNRTLTISIDQDWKQRLRSAADLAETGIQHGRYQGEFLNFATPATFFGHLNMQRWNLLNLMLGLRTIDMRELARRLRRDVRYVHEDATALVQLGLLEENEHGAVSCPYASIHIDMTLTAKLKQAA